jgi:hypothetical protein
MLSAPAKRNGTIRLLYQLQGRPSLSFFGGDRADKDVETVIAMAF